MSIARSNMNTQSQKIKKFEVGEIYYTRYANSHDTIIKVKIIARTEKTVKWIRLHPYLKPEVRTSRPFVFEGVESFYPTGKYSMAPVISADWIYGKCKY